MQDIFVYITIFDYIAIIKDPISCNNFVYYKSLITKTVTADLVIDWLYMKIVTEINKKIAIEIKAKQVVLKIIIVDWLNGIDKIDGIDRIDKFDGVNKYKGIVLL